MNAYELVALILLALAAMGGLATLMVGAYPEFFEGLLPESEDEDEDETKEI